MKKNNITNSLYKAVVFMIFLSALIVFIGCSSKKDEIPANTSEPCTPPDTKSIPTAKAVEESNDSNVVSSPLADNNESKKKAGAKNTVTADANNFTGENEPSIDDIKSELSYYGTSSERKIELLDSLRIAAAGQDPNIIEVVQKAVADPNSEVSQAAISLLDGYEDPNILPAVGAAMQRPDEEVRKAAVELLGNVEDPQVADMLAAALNDPSEDVRAAAIDVLQKKDDVQPSILEYGIASPYDEVKEMSLSLLESKSSPTAVDILITGLEDNDSDFREKVNDTLESLIGQRFDTYEQATQWWNINRGNFDEDLSPRDPNSPPKN